MRLTVGMTGATGAPFGVRLLETLAGMDESVPELNPGSQPAGLLRRRAHQWPFRYRGTLAGGPG